MGMFFWGKWLTALSRWNMGDPPDPQVMVGRGTFCFFIMTWVGPICNASITKAKVTKNIIITMSKYKLLRTTTYYVLRTTYCVLLLLLQLLLLLTWISLYCMYTLHRFCLSPYQYSIPGVILFIYDRTDRV